MTNAEIDRPRNVFGNGALLASELIAELKSLIKEHGDQFCFCLPDYEWCDGASFDEQFKRINLGG